MNKINFQEDTKSKGFLYFQNGFLEITKDEIDFKPYSALNGYVWKSYILPEKFEYKSQDNTSEFETFLRLAINKAEAFDDELSVQKWNSTRSTIGYLLHAYKDPSLTKAVVAVDKRITYTGDPNGRSGKSLLSKALAKVIKTILIDGQKFDPKNEFSFARVQLDTRLINFNDVKPTFDFNNLFSQITEDFIFSKKRIDEMSIPFKQSPKFYISTNFTLKGDGDSARGRQQVIEFSDYFNAELTPLDVFGHRFFDEWDESEYRRFYRFMISCIQYYLQSGLVPFPLENYEVRKLTSSPFGQDFFDYVNEDWRPVPETKYNKDEEIERFRKKYPQWTDKPEKNTFTKWLSNYGTMNEWVINPHKEGGRWKSNGQDLIMFVPKEKAKDFSEKDIKTPANTQTDLAI